MHLTLPSIPGLRDRCAAADEVLVSAPFYSREGLGWIRPPQGGKVEFWTRLNPHDWAVGVSDPPALLDFARKVGPGDVTIRVNRALHAKVYMVDREWSWIGSPNLSRAAFQRNVELVAELGQEETESLDVLLSDLRDRLRVVSLDDLETIVEVAGDAVQGYEEATVTEDLLAAVRLVDEVLSPPSQLAHSEQIPQLDDFIGFVKTLQGEIVQVVLSHHFNWGAQNRQGHVKQSYYAAALFLSDAAGAGHTDELREMSLNEYPELPPKLVDDWVAFLDENAAHGDDEREYSFSTLRNILPERLGGYTTGGGGASGTLTRVFPLVAHFLND